MTSLFGELWQSDFYIASKAFSVLWEVNVTKNWTFKVADYTYGNYRPMGKWVKAYR